LRYLFGFTGAPLISGAFDQMNCTRCTSGDILTYLTSLDAAPPDAQLDIDSDGETDALTDGLLALLDA
jgi:hypothetical protein